MRFDASSGNLTAAGFAFVGLALTFLLLIASVPPLAAAILIITFVIAAALSFWGAAGARREERALRSEQTKATLPVDLVTIEALREHTAALRDAATQARFAETKRILSGTGADRAEGTIIGRSSRAVRRSQLEPRARYLERKDAEAIIRKVSEGINGLRKGMTSEEIKKDRIKIMLVSIGAASETVSYRLDLADAFSGGGLEIRFEEWFAGRPEYEEFLNAVSILESRPGNLLRPIIIDALRAAGVRVREAAWPRVYKASGDRDVDDSPGGIWLVVGERR